MEGVKYTEKEVKALKAKVLKYIEENRLTLAEACTKAKLGYTICWKWRRADIEFGETVRQLLLDRDEFVGDLAENRLMRNISEGKERSIEFYLSTKHKHKGYVKRIENVNREAAPFKLEDLDSVTDEEAANAYSAMLKAEKES